MWDPVAGSQFSSCSSTFGPAWAIRWVWFSRTGTPHSAPKILWKTKYIWVDLSPYLKNHGWFFPAIAMLVEPGNIYVNEQKLQHGPRFATMAIAAQAGFWRLRDLGLWDGFFQWWMLMEEILILVETLEFLHGTFSMSTGALHRYESPKFWLGHSSDLNFIWRIPRLFRA